MGDVSAGFHVGSYAYDPNAELRHVFAVRENQQDGLSTILKYCQDECGFRPGDTDIRGFVEVLDQFSAVLVPGLSPTTFGLWFQSLGRMPSIREMVEHLPDNSRLVQFLDTIPSSGYYNRTIVQFITELEGDNLTLYMIKIHMDYSSDRKQESVCLVERYVDRDEMAREADWLVSKVKEKARIEDWAKGISSPGY